LESDLKHASSLTRPGRCWNLISLPAKFIYLFGFKFTGLPVPSVVFLKHAADET